MDGHGIMPVPNNHISPPFIIEMASGFSGCAEKKRMKLYTKCADIRLPFGCFTVTSEHREKTCCDIRNMPAAVNKSETQGVLDRGDNTVRDRSISGGIGTLF
jgi:hypothetical protein